MFKCELCEKSFVYKSKLKEHQNTKTPCNVIKGNHDCQLCNIKFNHKSNLEKHKKSKKTY